MSPCVDLINTFLVPRGHWHVADKRRTRALQARTAPACLGDMCMSTVKPGHTCPCGGRGATDPCERAQRVHWHGRCRVLPRRRCCVGPNLAASRGLLRPLLVWRRRIAWGRRGGLPPTSVVRKQVAFNGGPLIFPHGPDRQHKTVQMQPLFPQFNAPSVQTATMV
jgi:hypothetical protein